MDTPYTVREHNGTPIRASVHCGRAAAATVVYLHGGGCIFGHRDDLPQPYIDLFIGHGYNVVALDYLLAPESQLPEIIDVLHATLLDIVTPGRNELAFDVGPYVLMGRSAGSFLAVRLVARLVEEGGPLPVALLSFYGYGSLDDKDFLTESRYYNTYSRVDDLAYQAALSLPKLSESSLSNRSAVYVYHRQRGTWPEALLGEVPASDTTIPGDIVSQFPPTLLIHSVNDYDVPFRCSKDLARKIPKSKLVSVDDGDQHDFDRDPDSRTGLPMYRDALRWLSTILQPAPKT